MERARQDRCKTVYQQWTTWPPWPKRAKNLIFPYLALQERFSILLCDGVTRQALKQPKEGQQIVCKYEGVALYLIHCKCFGVMG